MSLPSPSQTPLSVSQLTLQIKQHLESKFLSVLLQGEISNFTRQASSGHLYFSLKDQNAQIGAIMFRTDAQRLTPPPKAGDQVIVRGELSVYPPQGTYKIIVRELYYVGLGALLLRFEQLKQKLEQRGWFASDRKKPLPEFPKRIGVVTSPTGAVIQDMLNILNKRFPGFQLLLNPVRVQGEGAAAEIAAAIGFFNQQQCVDVMIIARGGGSLEDLWPFNEEIVATAIYESRIPVISAVGHETDFTLSDFVADVRAPTPTAAAQLVVPEKMEVLDRLSQGKRRAQQYLLRLIKQQGLRLSALQKHPIFSSATSLLGLHIQRLDDLVQRLDYSWQLLLNRKRMQLTAHAHQLKGLQPNQRLADLRQRLTAIDKSLKSSMLKKINEEKIKTATYSNRLDEAWKSQLQRRQSMFNKPLINRRLDQYWQQAYALKKTRLEHLVQSLESIDPRNLLRKGYSILFSEKEHSLIISTKDLRPQQEIRAYLSDGTVLMNVIDIPSTNPGAT